MYFFPLQSVAQSPEIRATLAGAKPESFVLTADQCSENNKLSNARCFTIVRIGILLPKLFSPTVRKNCSSDQNNFWQQNAFLTCSWRFLISNKSEQLEFKLEKLLGFRNMQEKLENLFF